MIFLRKFENTFRKSLKIRVNFDKTSDNSRKILRNFIEFGAFFRKFAKFVFLEKTSIDLEKLITKKL